MGRPCKICTHEDAQDINKALIEGQMTYVEIETRFSVSRFALKRHKQNHIGDALHEIKRTNAAQARTDFVATLEGYNSIIGKLPKILDSTEPTIAQILTAMKQRSEIMGEAIGPSEITIKWGIGAEEEVIITPKGMTDDEVEQLEQQSREEHLNADDSTTEDEHS